MRKYILGLVLTMFSMISLAQEETAHNFFNIGMKTLSFGYGIEFPHGDLADRYGSNLKFTLGAERITRTNWIYGLNFSFMFGQNVGEDALSSLRLSNGEILGADNAFADVFSRERGMFIGLTVGKIIPLRPRTRSGIRIAGSFGVMQHYIRHVDESQSLPQIQGDYKKGYDRMTRGLALREFVGYQHISEDKRINFYIGLELTQGFTRHVRNLDFDTGLTPNTKLRYDGLLGIKAAWILPFFDDYASEEIFY